MYIKFSSLNRQAFRPQKEPGGRIDGALRDLGIQQNTAMGVTGWPGPLGFKVDRSPKTTRKKVGSFTHWIHGAAIYGNMDPINIPPLC